MDFDFSTMCDDQLTELLKKLNSAHKKFMKEYKMGLGVINHSETNENLSEIMLKVEDIFNDNLKSVCVSYINAFNLIKKELGLFL